ncbi:rhamnan synthesis F family protein [Grimontia marina]|uniref:Rhamnan synthesis protein F n=1 Tax=Grimontia marina TaxID=646534 RepID=A0A128ET55_9GAMM|nr:rhamnan synthesis F family protein [Grimontia marina]CZF77324.1 Rhamnan synthesis protein F [Grimontia marina]
MKRIAVFAHYDRDNLVDDHVYAYIESLKNFVDKVVFVSVSNPKNLDILDGIVDEIIVRENVGYDFMSWSQGIASQSNMFDFDELILCNDSCYGPLRSFEDVFNEMSTRGVDVWGITDSSQISYHLQSYFLVFNRAAFSSDVFVNFMTGIKHEESKFDVVEKYEVGLTSCLISNGFKVDSLIKSKEIVSQLDTSKVYKDKIRRVALLLKKNILDEKGFRKKIIGVVSLIRNYYTKLVEFSLADNSNIKFVAWKELINAGDPFVKVMLLRDNPSNVPDLDDWPAEIKKVSNYNIELISKHLSRVRND